MPAKSIPSKKSKKASPRTDANNSKLKSIPTQTAAERQRYLEPAFTSQLMEHVHKAKQKAVSQKKKA